MVNEYNYATMLLQLTAGLHENMVVQLPSVSGARCLTVGGALSLRVSGLLRVFRCFFNLCFTFRLGSEAVDKNKKKTLALPKRMTNFLKSFRSGFGLIIKMINQLIYCTSTIVVCLFNKHTTLRGNVLCHHCAV